MCARTSGCRPSRLSAVTPSRGRSRASRSNRSSGSGTASARNASIAGVPQSRAAKRSTNSGHGRPQPLGVPAAQLVVPAPGDLLGHQRPHLRAHVDRPARGDQRVGLRGPEEARQRRTARAQLVVRLGVVGGTARRARHQVGLVAGRHVAQPVPVRFEAAAAPFVEQHDEVDEREAEAAHQRGLAGGEHREVGVGGLLRRQVAQARGGGARGEVELVRGGGGVEVPGGEHDGVGAQRRPALQVHDLGGAVGVDLLGEPGRAGAVQVHPHARGQPAEHVLQHPAQVGALQAAAGERGGGDGGQLLDQLGTDLGLRSAPTPRTTGRARSGPRTRRTRRCTS